jgi:hypothetical protein
MSIIGLSTSNYNGVAIWTIKAQSNGTEKVRIGSAVVNDPRDGLAMAIIDALRDEQAGSKPILYIPYMQEVLELLAPRRWPWTDAAQIIDATEAIVATSAAQTAVTTWSSVHRLAGRQKNA